MGRFRRGLLAGAAAGAAGTTALNAVTYLDMAARGRPASSTPRQAVEKITEVTGTDIAGEGETRENRKSGLGPLIGAATGVGVGALAGLLLAPLPVRLPRPLLGLALGAAAMAGSDVPMTRLGITDPSSWTAGGWAADVVPHLAYGAVTASVLHALARR